MRYVGRCVAGAVGLYALACAVCPAFARAALEGLALPAMDGLHRLTARVPFPVIEPLAAGAAAVAPAALVSGAASGRRALLRRLRGVARAALMALCALTLLWGPALAIPAETPASQDAEALERLCGRLIGALNGAAPDGIDAAEALRRAGDVAGMPGRAVKAARYPEWMRACGCAGLYVPLTGEALVDADAPPALIPFTAVHELMHLSGVADEGAANLLAWERCLSAGGAFADSARLWALRYAMGLLRQADEGAWRRAGAKMEGALSRAFRIAGGEVAPSKQSRFGITRGDYAALAGYLAAGP